MAPPRPARLVPALRALLYWSLVYGYCGLCASVHLLKLLWSIGKAPAQTFRRTARAHPPACLSDPSLGTHCYVRIKDSGLRFHYVAAGERGRPLMLLLHGFPEFWYSWRHQLREFKRYSKCVLVGHDWGGMIAWLIAICYPEMIMKLIVINFPHPSVFTDYILRHPAQLLRSSFYYFFQIPWFPEFMFSINDFKALKHLFTSQSTGIGRRGRRLTTDDLEAYIYVFSQPGALSGPINHYRNIFNCLPLEHHMVTTPTLLLWGEEDAFMEAEMAEVTKVYVRNYFRLIILSEGSHWLQQDQPDIVNRLIWAFLRDEGRRERQSPVTSL
ncbi:epoxide hydrolase 4 isoform X2 [Arvicola amphibius]|uniref:epoxide hydrolase 4 isoform X2 n=1 Tax=Arvicola amphibius TaxID=1047088 RepID=UPI0018E335BE|nr:epoxide hydrolase 4 isoform X2 [Arvicola amphibius]